MNQTHNKITINNQWQQQQSLKINVFCFVSRNLPNMGQILLLHSKYKFHASQQKSRADSKAEF